MAASASMSGACAATLSAAPNTLAVRDRSAYGSASRSRRRVVAEGGDCELTEPEDVGTKGRDKMLEKTHFFLIFLTSIKMLEQIQRNL